MDDMIRDNLGKTCSDVAGGADTSTLISGQSMTEDQAEKLQADDLARTVSRSRYHEAYLALLAAYIASPASDAASSRTSIAEQAASSSASSQVSAASGHVSNAAAEQLYHYIARPRSRCIDFGARDPATGTTLLHEAVKRKDLGLIKLAIAKGADVLSRDKRGKVPLDSAKDDRIKSVLQQGEAGQWVIEFWHAILTIYIAATSKEGNALRKTLGSPSSGAAPLLGASPAAMRGYLQKWTNMARGYRSRWFVLDNGERIAQSLKGVALILTPLRHSVVLPHAGRRRQGISRIHQYECRDHQRPQRGQAQVQCRQQARQKLPQLLSQGQS